MNSIVVNNIDITDLCTSFQMYDEMERLIGNALSTEIKITMKNKDSQLNELLDYPFIIDGKTYLVYEKPERWTNTISLTLYDLMSKGNINYDTTIAYPCTISDQLDEMALLMDVEIDKNTLSDELLQKVVGWYDNTYFIREYLAWIAECDGKIAMIENDKIIFRQLATSSFETTFCSDYELIEQITFTRVCQNNDVGEPLEVGTDEERTLYIGKDNLYIELSDIQRIYDMYNGLSFYSCNKFNCKEVEGFSITDILTYHNISILPITIKTTVYGGSARNAVEMSCKINTKTAELVKVKKANPYVRKVEVAVDQLAGEYSVFVQNVSENYATKTDMNITAEGIKTDISKTITDLEDDIKEVVNKQAQYEQGVTGFGATYVTQTQYEDDMNNLVTTGRLTKYFRYDAEYEEYGEQTGALLIGYKDDSNPTLIEAKVSPVGFALLENNTKMLWIEQTQTYLKNATVEGALQIGLNNGLKLLDEGENGWSFTI